ncbi:MAG TPA: metalloprotease PmbA [Gammaproteobacteria bacterium]|jgi:PmbA protein
MQLPADTGALATGAHLRDVLSRALDMAKRGGATAAEADLGSGHGLSVTVRNGEVETVEHQRDKGLSITVYVGARKGSASTTDFSDAALAATVEAACTIGGYASEDECAGLLEPRYLAHEVPDLELSHPWTISAEEAIARARECEAEAKTSDARITNSEGAVLGTYAGRHLYGNTHGFLGGWDWTTHSVDCNVIASAGGTMQRDGWYTKARDPLDLDDLRAVGRRAAARTVARLGARRLSTRKAPVVFEAPLAGGLFAAFVTAISGAALYRKASFMQDSLGTRVFAPLVGIREEPHLRKALGSAPFDSDGMATRPRDLVRDGTVMGYVLSAYSARKLKMEPTGNGGGVHNVVVAHGEHDLPGLLREMGTGLLVTDLIGFGINQVTGDYSRGASGFWIENGTVQYPVEEITIAGNLREMYGGIVAIGSDVDRRGNFQSGSVLIDRMTIAGG